MNPADEMVPNRETTQRQLAGAAAGSFDSLKEQLRAVVERPSPQSKPVEDLHGSDGKLDEPLRTTLKSLQPISLSSKPVADLHGSGDKEQLEDLLRLSPQRKPEDDKPVESDDVRPGITSYPHEASERQANYVFSIDNKMTGRSSRGFARYLVAILFGVAATLAWQSYGDVAKQIVATSAPGLGSSPEAKQMIASWVQQLGWTKPPAGSVKQALPVAQTAPATPSIDPVQVQQMIQSLAALRESAQQLAAGQKSLAALAQTVDQLAASQDQIVHQIDMLQTSNKEILAKIAPAPPPPRPIATSARKPTPTAPPSSPAPVVPPMSLAPIPAPDR